MKNVKVIAGFSVFGFLLSFLFGLFSRSGFFRVLLSAFLFAVVFAAMGFIVQYVFKNVLDMGMDSEDSGFSETQSSVGQHVDITVEEEDIPESGDDSHFMVGTNLQMLNESDYGSGGKEVKEEPSINSSSAEGAKVEMKAEEKPSVPDEKKILRVMKRILQGQRLLLKMRQVLRRQVLFLWLLPRRSKKLMCL